MHCSRQCADKDVMTTATDIAPEQRAVDVLIQKFLEFCQLLRGHGLEITAGRVIDTCRTIEVIDIFRSGDFYTALEANLVSNPQDRELFHQLFLAFWRGPSWAAIPDPCLPAWNDDCAASPPPVLQEHTPFTPRQEQVEARSDEDTATSVALYSPQEVLTHKDFGKMSPQELLRVQRLLSTMARQMATALSRRKKTTGHGPLIDAGRTMRRSMRYGGEVVDLVHRDRKVGKTKMVVLCDVSGSMDVYTSFLLQFLYGLQNGLKGVETIVFSTRLTRITALLRRRNINAALELISETVRDWSGGTKIGTCLQAFNDTMAANMVTSKTLVIIISDGWDTGDSDVLEKAMAFLKARALRIIWLNPLLGTSNYRPVCKGMSTALPYVHDFLPVHNLVSLRQFGRLVQSLT